MIEECVETVDLTPIEQQRNKIDDILSYESESVRSQWRLYMSKAEIFGSPSNSWYELENYLLKMIERLLKQFNK